MKRTLDRLYTPNLRLGYLDALRGFAAIYVVIFHISLIPKPALTMPDWMNNFVSFGGSGVTLFFILSGFSMSLTWGRHSSCLSPTRSFFITRFFRIAPLFYIWLIITLLRDWIFKGDYGLHSPTEIAANLLFLFNFNEYFQPGIVWASWTIGVEMLFYLIFPAIAIYSANNITRFIFILTASVIFAMILQGNIFQHYFVYPNSMLTSMGFIYHLPAFFIGVLCCNLWVFYGDSTSNRAKQSIGVKLGLLLILGLILIAVVSPRLINAYYFSCALYGILLLIFSMLDRNFLVNSISNYLGKISYSMYLNHPNLIYLLTPLYILIYDSGTGSAISFLTCIALTFSILIPFSHLTFKFIEEPFVSFGKKQVAKYA